MKERQYERAMKLMISLTKDLADLYDIFQEPIEDEPTEEEKKQLILYKTKLACVIQKFKGGN
jgi:predicted transcriptional regulator